MNVLSCFDGISAGRLALQRANINVSTYYRSEVDKYANQVAMHHYPNDVQLGDVTKWREWDIDWGSIDLLIGGSPCQGFSFAGKQAGTKAILDGIERLVTDRETYLDLKANGAEFLSQSYLFWEYVLILDHIKSHNPNVKFLLENVKMKKELLQMIDDAMGVKSIVINSALLSAQNRVRHYWCNWEVAQPEDKGVLFSEIMESEKDHQKPSEKVIGRLVFWHKDDGTKQVIGTTKGEENTRIGQRDAVYSSKYPKMGCLTATDYKQPRLIYHNETLLQLNIKESCRLQTFPDNWCDGISKTQAYRSLGNSWTVDVIAHIFKEMKNESI